jgi:hypothetical protein
MSTADATKTVAGRPWPNGDPATWLYLDELPTPPEVLRKVEEKRRRNGWWWRWWYKTEINSITRELKTMHYFPGKELVYRRTPCGWLILLVAGPFAPEIEAFLDALSSEERCQVATFYVFDPNDDRPRWLFFPLGVKEAHEA